MAKGPHTETEISCSRVAKERLGKWKIGAMTWDEALLEVLEKAESRED